MTVSRRSAPALAGKDDPAASACSGHSKSTLQLHASAARRTSSALGQYLKMLQDWPKQKRIHYVTDQTQSF